MELEFDDSVVRGLRGYVRLVSHALGMRGDCSCVQADPPISAYVALDGRLSRFPDRDVALLWDERQGWSAALEAQSGEALTVVAHLGEDLVPPPETVATWAQRLFRGHLGHTGAHPGIVDGDEVRRRLTAYVSPAFAVTFADRVQGPDGEPLAIG